MPLLMRFTLNFALIGMLSACDSGEVWRDDPYVVSWIDTGKNTALRFDLGNGDTIGRVGKTVIAVGSDDHHVVAKQRVSGNTNYYIVKRSDDKATAKLREVILGPLSEEEFKVLKSSLQLPQFSWSSE